MHRGSYRAMDPPALLATRNRSFSSKSVPPIHSFLPRAFPSGARVAFAALIEDEHSIFSATRDSPFPFVYSLRTGAHRCTGTKARTVGRSDSSRDGTTTAMGVDDSSMAPLPSEAVPRNRGCAKRTRKKLTGIEIRSETSWRLSRVRRRGSRATGRIATAMARTYL